MLSEIDASWREIRPKGDLAENWEWNSTAGDHDVFLVEDRGTPLALWRSAKPAIQLKGRLLYRLDNIEVSHEIRKGGLGRFAMTLVASRALELSCDGIILAAPESVEGWYRQLGAADANNLGWTYPAELYALVFSEDAVKRFAEIARELEVEKSDG